jgi:hypothetical protein
MAPSGTYYQTHSSALGTGPNASSAPGNFLRASQIVQEIIQVARATLPEVTMPRLPRCNVRVRFWLVVAPKRNARSHGWGHRNCAATEREARGAAFLRKDAGAIWHRGQAEMLRMPPRKCTWAGARRRTPDARLARKPRVRCTVETYVLNSAPSTHVIGRENDSLRSDWLDVLLFSRQFRS